MNKVLALCGAVALTISCNVGLASNFTVVDKEPNSVFLYMNQFEKSFYKPNSYHVLFQSNKNDNKLYVADAESKNLFMVLEPYEDAGVAYSVKEIPVKEANCGLFEVTATAGAHAQNLGYWIIGAKDNHIKVYVDYKTLAKNGFDPESWNRLHGKYEAYNGNYAISNTTEYMPPWGQTSADLIDVEKAKWACVWNDKKQGFDLQKLEPERAAFIDDQYKAMVYIEHFIKGNKRFAGLLNNGQLSYVRHNPDGNDGLEVHEISVIEDDGMKITTKATFRINEIADVLYYNMNKRAFEKVN